MCVLGVAAEWLCVSQTLMLLLLESQKRDRLQQCCALGSKGDVEWTFPADWILLCLSHHHLPLLAWMGQRKTFTLKALGWDSENLTEPFWGSYAPDLIPLCPLPPHCRTLVWARQLKTLSWEPFGSLKGQTSTLTCGIMGLNLLLSHWAAHVCVSLAQYSQVSWWSKLCLKIYFFPKNIRFYFAISLYPPQNLMQHRQILNGLRPDRGTSSRYLGCKVQS